MQHLLYMPRVTDELFGECGELERLVAGTAKSTQCRYWCFDRYRITTVEADESQTAGIVIEHWTHGIAAQKHLPNDFFHSPDYQKIADMGDNLDGPLAEDAEIRRGDKGRPIASFEQAPQWLMEEAKRPAHPAIARPW